MPAPGIAANIDFAPSAKNPPCELKFEPWNWVNRMMMASTGIATFHQVIPALILLKSRMAKKFSPVKSAIKMMLHTKPLPVTSPLFGLNRPGKKPQWKPAAYCITAKTSIGATVTACTQEKNPNEMPAMLPKEKCGKRAVPPETGYIPPSSAWMRARMMTAMPPITQARIADVPAEYAPFHEPNSQPEPIRDVTEAQVAPISPISRLRPTSVGLVTLATDSAVMVRTFFPVRIRRPYGPLSTAHGNDRLRWWLALNLRHFGNA